MNTEKNNIIIIVLVIFLIGAGLLLFKNTNAPVVNNSNQTHENIPNIYPPEDLPKNETPKEPTPPIVIPTAPKTQQPITIGDVTILPLAIVEDSRCPQGAMCIWAGRFVLKTRIIKGGTSTEVNLELGQEEKVLGAIITLIDAEPSPDMRNQNKTPFGDYKFTFEVK